MSKDSMSALVEVLKAQTKTSLHLDAIRKAQAEIRTAQIEESNRRLSERQGKIIKEFSELTPQESLNKHLGLRHEGTGMWFRDCPEFQNFLSDDNASLWMYGIPGAGKSVLTSTIIEFVNELRTQNVITAYFFCEHNNPDTQDVRNILGSIVGQLSIQNTEAFAEMEAFYDQHTSFDKFTADNQSILGLIWSMSNHADATIIVIDGLDECLKNQDHVLGTLAELSDSDNGTVKVIFTSRDERNIQRCLEDFTRWEIKASKADVRLFVAAELESRFKEMSAKSSSLKDEILQHLVDNSDGM
ncbi:uncharacterized protein LTHEOB_6195 [Neofusicoccum parvum]|nr:uncharacterized protein LTHEOB_6195 [Neofusicoccum parvum]